MSSPATHARPVSLLLVAHVLHRDGELLEEDFRVAISVSAMGRDSFQVRALSFGDEVVNRPRQMRYSAQGGTVCAHRLSIS